MATPTLSQPPTGASPTRPSSMIIHNVRGAEGGVEAITARRRNSGSFKTMSSGGLVKNSPFVQRLAGPSGGGGQTSPTKTTFGTPSRGLYGAESRIPAPASSATGSVRRTSGSRKASGELLDGPVKENSNPDLFAASGAGSFDKVDSPSLSRRSQSPSVPFKPTRNTAPSTSCAPAAASSTASNTSPFKPTRPTFSSASSRQPSQDADPPRRQTASFAALRANGGLVSSSPFTTASNSNSNSNASPELQQVPYEIGALSHESAPFGYGASAFDQAASPDLPGELGFSSVSSKASGQASLGVRPGAALPNRAFSAAAPTPPPQPVQPSGSSLSPVRRGMRGPRSLDDTAPTTDQDAGALSRTLRRQPSNKTVTWAETEEVLEFEVEEEEARRLSMMSDATISSTASDDERRYAGGESSEEEGWGAGEYSFEEGGSVVEIRPRDVPQRHRHGVEYADEDDDDEDGPSDAEDSVVSTGSSAMDDMIGQIDSYIHEGDATYDDNLRGVEVDIFSPSQIGSPAAFSDTPDLPVHSPRQQQQQQQQLGSPVLVSGYSSPRQAHAAPMSAFSISTVSGTADDELEGFGSPVLSTSSYGDDADEHELSEEQQRLQQARESILARARASLNNPPGSPSRPPLPSPPTQSQSTFASSTPLPPVAAAPAHLAPPTTAASTGLSKSESQYSLPDIPGTSPFLGFEDDGTAGSVVTLDSRAGLSAPPPTTQPLQPHQRTSSVAVVENNEPLQSTPTSSASKVADSPIMSATRHLAPSASGVETSPALSRQASLIGSDVSASSSAAASAISWYGSSANGSLRGGTVRLGRDRLDERMKAHQALFGGSPTLGTNNGKDSAAAAGAAFGAFPATRPVSTSTAAATVGAGAGGPFSQPMQGVQSAPSSSAPLSSPTRGLAIEARPAPKARSATLSSSMLPTFAASASPTKLAVGDVLTGERAEEMRSPLERLQRGVEGHEAEGGMWRSGDSLLGVNELAEEDEEEDDDEGEETEREDDSAAKMVRSASGSSAIQEREQAILAKRREKAGMAPPAKGKGRRRSRSTGDADLAETASVPMENHHTMPELGFERRLATGDDNAAFASGVLESLDDIYNSRNRTYRVRESKHLVVVSDFAGSKAGDVDPGRAWRKKRPSNVHDIARSMSTMSIGSQQARRTRELSGQLFVHLRDVTFDNVPMPRQRVTVTATLDNGRQRVDAATRELGAKVSLKKEFELVCSEALAFSIHFSVPPAPPPPAPAPSPAPTPPASPSKPHRALRIFSSPKKRSATPTRLPAPAPPPTPDPFYDYVSPDGQLATARVVFASEAAECRLQKKRILVPFGPKASKSPRSCSGSLVVELLFVPAVPGVTKASLPKSMDEVVEGLELADWATKITHQSVLTQLGGDCPVWRRRQVKLRGSTLVPYSEVTKRSFVEINLALVDRIEDLNNPSMPTPGSRASKYDEDDDVGRMDNSFRLVFKDGNRIDFFADSIEAKAQWLAVLNTVVGKADNKKTAPDWAVAARKLPLPKAA
ncbi:hypothetical protein JCM6882_007017 [Rhodosporidiobolus microsporus]